MKDFFLASSIAVAVLSLAPLYRIVRGPSVFDRVVAVGMLGTKTIVLLLLMGYATGRPDQYVDLSLGYGLALIIGTLVAAKYFESLSIRPARPPPSEPDVPDAPP